ncbi:MAG: hypothetical protein L6R38_001793 [Xanthoria sp. 2 TBL-2021]|nr:MAG: hypothetical protein L6R38_001793 [Xanthoria sp. 2 TBL-2021]
MARDISSTPQRHNSWDILRSQDHSGPLTTSHQSEPRNGYPGASIPPGTSTDNHPRRTYSDPGIFEETAISDHQESFAQKSKQDLAQSYRDTNLDLSAMIDGGSTSLPTKLHDRVDQSSSGSAKRKINGASDSSRRPGPPSSGVGNHGLERPRENKRRPEVEDPVASHGIQQPRKKHKPISQSNYTQEEKKWVVYYLKGEVSRRNLTESKWDIVSRELVKHGLRRSKCSIKAWWSRYGREETGFDERQNPNGRNLVTSKQDPEDRKKARRLKKQQLRKEGQTMLDRDSEGPAAGQCRASHMSSGPRL